ncbi:hypothetical protein P691DRAFT_708792 [Macrolepiota fuliginosa MF-IS2]|uniref:DUF5648 domain-containing protein n=1 Tax=Macrolepiota fuliginosa MF-IS2 TaxID=1400762 RepID=A0A9P6C258_9AGAR|nr:hypothetical protein P691DRAFT_708792 [Macrolepiota fuliginosa MF-IS2]
MYHAGITDHFYTTDVAEADHAVNVLGYSSDGVAGLIFPTQLPGTVPFYRLYNEAIFDHFYTTSNPPNVSGYTLNGVAGYVYSDTACGGIPFYRMWSGPATDHYYTSTPTELDSAEKVGYTLDGVDGYILPA